MKFTVEKMSCGHCVRAVTLAIQDADLAAQVEVNLQEKQVTVSSNLAAETVAEILEKEGYPTTVLN